MTPTYDIAIVGGGVMGCSAALTLKQGGMRPVVIERGHLGEGASGVNAGTLSLQIKRIELMPYALRGHRLWKDMGSSVGFHQTGGYVLAFTDEEAGLLVDRQTKRAAAGAPIELVSPAEVRKAEPSISDRITAASYCPMDGFANSLATGQYYRKRLKESSIDCRENSCVVGMNNSGSGFELRTSTGVVHASRLLLTAGAWLKSLAAMLDIDLPVKAFPNTVSVTERRPALVSSVIGHAKGVLSMKQKPNGTILIGGGWQGRGSVNRGSAQVSAEALAANLALARFALPNISNARVLRSWTGYDARAPDSYPLAGALPGYDDAYVLGCVRGGYTIGPYIGKLMADRILGFETELPLYDPGREFVGS